MISQQQAAVSVENLVVQYGAVRAVSGVSFTAQAGEVTIVLGPNGAGKTSTIEVCEGFRNGASGDVRVLGLDPKSQRHLLNSRMGVMLQGGGVYPSTKVGEVVRQYCTLYGKSVDPNALIETVGLSGLHNRTWRRLSGGEQQRLSLALALAARPDVAFLDEPTSGVDINGRDTIRNIIKNLANEGCAVIVATHELNEAERVADRVVIFDRGMVVANSTLDELLRGKDEIRFRSPTRFDVAALSAHIGADVQWMADASEYTVAGTADARRIADLSQWMADADVQITDLRAGQQRLEDVFRRLTSEEGR